MPAPVQWGRRLGDRRETLPVAFFVVLLVLLLTWAVGMPRYAAPDEIAHMVKAYGTARGETIGAPAPGEAEVARLMPVPASVVSGDPWCYAGRPDDSAACAVPNTDGTIGPHATTAGGYPPVYYALVGVPARVAGQATSVLFTRAVSAAINAALLAVAITIAVRRTGRHAGLVLVALTPMTLFISAAVNPSGLEICGTLLLWVALAALAVADRRPTRGQLLAVGSLAAVIVLSRPVAMPWVLSAFAAHAWVERGRTSAAPRAAWRATATALSPVVVAGIASSLWSRYAGLGLSDPRFRVEDSTATIVRTAIGRTVDLGTQAFGLLGWLDTRLPALATALWLVSIGLTATAVWLSGPSRLRWLLLALGTLWVAYPVVYVTLAHSPTLWQGRYTLPLLGGLVFCGLVAGERSAAGDVVSRVARVVAVAFVVIETVAFHQALRRFMVGAHGSLMLEAPGWRPPVNAWLLIGLNTAAATALAALTLAYGRRAAPGARRTSSP
jgi:hypothetical protein